MPTMCQTRLGARESLGYHYYWLELNSMEEIWGNSVKHMFQSYRAQGVRELRYLYANSCQSSVEGYWDEAWWVG